MKNTTPIPYLPDGKILAYVPAENQWMKWAENGAQNESLDPQHRTGAVIVKDGIFLGQGANGSEYHEKFGCKRKELGIPTGQGYDLCEGCHPKNHAEQKAIHNVKDRGFDPRGADLYLWGHWWCCQSCWSVMIDHGIRQVYLLDGADEIFKK